MPFEVLSFDFSWIGSRVTIEDALLRGGDMGAIGAGWLDLSAGALNITGTYIPAYSVNNLFGRIPLLGLALAGGQNEGLIGVTFKIRVRSTSRGCSSIRCRRSRPASSGRSSSSSDADQFGRRDQHVLLAAERQLDRTVDEVGAPRPSPARR